MRRPKQSKAQHDCSYKIYKAVNPSRQSVHQPTLDNLVLQVPIKVNSRNESDTVAIMITALAVIVKKEGMSHDDFVSHYENVQ